MADILDEVEQDWRAERTRRALTRYGALLAFLALLVVAGVGGLQAWRWSQARGAATMAASYLDATAAGTPAATQAERLTVIAQSAPPGYAALARLRAAAAQAEAGDAAAARAQWDLMARDAGTPALYRDLANLLWSLSAIGEAEPPSILARLAPLNDGPWRAGATEAKALLARATGDATTAERLFAELATDPASPPGIRVRAERLRAAGSG